VAFKNLVNGFRVFKANYISGNSAHLFQKLITEGQSPETLVIACSDSRIDPAILTNSSPGDFFSIRNIAALVPEWDEDGHSHGTSAAIEYAVSVLKVKHIIVLGHALCGGIRALAESPDTLGENTDMISRWIVIGIKARDKVRDIMKDEPIDRQASYLEQAAILVSMQNLLGFQSVRTAVEEGRLTIL
jgi:carbonic anhydrase